MVFIIVRGWKIKLRRGQLLGLAKFVYYLSVYQKRSKYFISTYEQAVYEAKLPHLELDLECLEVTVIFFLFPLDRGEA